MKSCAEAYESVKHYIGRAIRTPAELLFGLFPLGDGLVREQAFSFGNLLGLFSYEDLSGYKDELKFQDELCCCSSDYSQFTQSRIGFVAGLAIDAATLYAAFSTNPAISEGVRHFTRDLWALKAQTNIASAGLLAIRLGARYVDEKALESRLEETKGSN